MSFQATNSPSGSGAAPQAIGMGKFAIGAARRERIGDVRFGGEEEEEKKCCRLHPQILIEADFGDACDFKQHF